MVSKMVIEGPIVKVVTRFGRGRHIIVPEHCIAKKVRCSIVDDTERTNEDRKQVSNLLKGRPKNVLKKTRK